MLVLYLAGLLSTGSPLPTEEESIKHEPMTIIYQTSKIAMKIQLSLV